MKPFFSFYGGKWRAAPRYPEPEHSLIVEPFAGSAGYSVRHGANRPVLLLDKDPVIVGTWRYLIGVSSTEILSLPDLHAGQHVDDLPLPQEARWLIGWWIHKGAATPGKTPTSWMRKGTHTHSFWGETIRQRIASQVDTIRHWQVQEGDYTTAPDVAATWFVDPPYQIMGKHYKYGASDIDYAALGDWCRSRRGQVIVCENTGADWLPFEHYLNIKANPSKNGGKVSKEAIWTNKNEDGFTFLSN